jgi:hypothetical protein
MALLLSSYNSDKRIYYLTFKTIFMINLLYVVAVILVIAWAVGFLGYHAGGLIHILLVIAIIAVILRLIAGNRAL